MKKICSFHPSESAMANMFRRILAVEGIATFIRNERLGTAMGEIPFVECFPELWVHEDGDVERAQEILAAYKSEDIEDTPAWRCPACGEQVDGALGACWCCESPRPEEDEPAG